MRLSRRGSLGSSVFFLVALAACESTPNAASTAGQTIAPPESSSSPAPSSTSGIAPPIDMVDASVPPSAERCGNGLDDDGDKQIDEGCSCKAQEWQRCFVGDAKVAGVGACAWGRQDCVVTGEFGTYGSCTGSGEPSAERCGDGVDNDCNASVDEGCECAPGTVRSCFGGPAEAENKGLCKSGVQTCTAQGAWGSCDGQVLPAAGDVCDGLDEDCDAVVDNACECTPGATTTCYSGSSSTLNVGVCKAGAKTCVTVAGGGSTWSACSGEVLPGTETCNAIDDDCDGQIDQTCDCVTGTTRGCYGGPPGTADVGLCKSGTQACGAGGKWGACAGDVTPLVEACDNGKDDDCNGAQDNGCECKPGDTASCYSGPVGSAGVGQCKAGVRICAAKAEGGSAWGACTGEILPGVESCNTKDDDCDGRIDQTCDCIPETTRSCYGGPAGTGGVGRCKLGTQTCSAAGTWGGCSGDVTPAPEVCDNTIDDDCNGTVDNGCECLPGTTSSCYSGPSGTSGVGKCRVGTKTCSAKAQGGSSWSTCSGQVLPTTETCNAIDDDCNGQIDQTCECIVGETRACYGGPPGTSGVGLCKGGTQTCTAAGAWGSCAGDVTPAPDTCGNGKDDDCNGSADTGCVCTPGATASCYSGPAGTAGVGICRTGTKTCVAKTEGGSAWGSCTGQVLPKATDTCNAQDDDCDGVIDRPAPRGTGSVVRTVTWPGMMQTTSVRVYGDTLYVGDYGGIRLYDVTNGASPTFARAIVSSSAGERDVLVDGTVLYTADNYSGLGVWDMSAATAVQKPTLSFDKAQVYSAATLPGSRLLLTSADGVLGTTDLVVASRAQPLAPTILSLYNGASGADRATGLATVGNVAYVNFITGPTRVFDVTTNTPVLKTTLAMPGPVNPYDYGCWAAIHSPVVDAARKRLHVPRCGEGIFSFGIATPAAPTPLGDTSGLSCQPPISMDIRGTLGVELTNTELRVIDLATSAPVVRSVIPLGPFADTFVNAQQVRLSDDGLYAYVLLWRGGVLVVKTS